MSLLTQITTTIPNLQSDNIKAFLTSTNYSNNQLIELILELFGQNKQVMLENERLKSSFDVDQIKIKINTQEPFYPLINYKLIQTPCFFFLNYFQFFDRQAKEFEKLELQDLYYHVQKYSELKRINQTDQDCHILFFFMRILYNLQKIFSQFITQQQVFKKEFELLVNSQQKW